MVLVRKIEEPEEGLVYKSDNIKIKIGEKLIGNGVLYLTEDCLMWKPDDSLEGISMLWKQISLHGISNNPSKCIYLMLDHQLVWEGVYDPSAANGNANGNAMEQEEDDDSENDEGNESGCQDDMTEMWLIPNDITAVDQIFQSMKECQTLHPDSADSISDESDFMDAVEEQNEDEFDDDNHGENVNDMRNLNINQDHFEDA
ncbi:methylosome subunit pICln [Condylostylus longicornis]|uniref:methylosome subunit pICln n=1 Tax=Condylostylus longicornis TaxID=2530218 RepID=UPI00244E33C0|nr:methylosome subunit pICln [Condylostylus longicornis]XP_055373973.1 methylosome subunit pICln [Condylostylus longicornis]XP_055373974.1 methylosome subunit pICln [Condylostylus longicornis]